MAALLLLAPWLAVADEPEAKEEAPAVAVEAVPAEVKLGEPFWLEVRVSGAAPLRLPDRPKLEPFDELSREEKQETREGKKIQLFRLKLANYQALGEQKVPAFELVPLQADGGAGTAVSVPETPVKILSMLEGTENPQPRDISGPVSIWWTDYRPLALLALLLLWLGLAGWLRLRRQEHAPAWLAEPPPPERQAHEIALERLRAVVEEQLLRQGKVQEYFDRVSDVVREYIGNRYGFFALDLTSGELLEDLRDRPTPGLDLAVLRRLLEEADLVKFARVKPGDEMCSRAINGALSIVEATRPRQPEAAA